MKVRCSTSTLRPPQHPPSPSHHPYARTLAPESRYPEPTDINVADIPGVAPEAYWSSAAVKVLLIPNAVNGNTDIYDVQLASFGNSTAGFVYKPGQSNSANLSNRLNEKQPVTWIYIVHGIGSSSWAMTGIAADLENALNPKKFRVNANFNFVGCVGIEMGGNQIGH